MATASCLQDEKAECMGCQPPNQVAKAILVVGYGDAGPAWIKINVEPGFAHVDHAADLR